MKITWHGHSCFKVETHNGSVVFDPYEDGRVPGYALLPRDLSADVLLCSHQHGDHNAAHLVSVSGAPGGITVDKLQTYHDDEAGAKRGENIIHIVNAEGMRLAHMGDLGCMPTEAQIAALKGVDVILVPVGGFYTIDAAQAKALVDAVGARVVVPMHYRTEQFGYPVIGELNAFTDLCSDVVYYKGNSFTVTAQTSSQTAVLKYCP